MDRQFTPAERRKLRLKKATPYVIGLGVFTVVAVVIGFSMRKSIKESDLLVCTADTGSIQISVTGSGKVVPAFEEVINSPISSRIMEVYCDAGDSVGPGTPLLRLDLQSSETELTKLQDQIEIKRQELAQSDINASTRLSDLAMQVEVKEMAVNRLQAELCNERYLDSLGSGTGDKVRQAELAYNTGRLELAQLRAQLENEHRLVSASRRVKDLDISIAGKNLAEMARTLDDARIKAPRSATLTFIANEIGRQVNVGEKLAVISDLSHFKIDGELADAYGDNIAVGSRAVVRIGRDRLDGTVVNLTPLSRNGVLDFSVRLDDDANPRLRSGLKSEIYVLCDVRDDAIRIRNGSYYSGPGSYRLFVLSPDGTEAEARLVSLGESNYEYVEVLSGIQPGDRVIISDMSKFKENNTLKINR